MQHLIAVCNPNSVVLALFACRTITRATTEMYCKEAAWWEYRLKHLSMDDRILKQLFFVTSAAIQQHYIHVSMDDCLQNRWHGQIVSPHFAKLWIDMFDCFSLHLFAGGAVLRDKLNKQLCWKWTAIVKSPHVILQMPGMSNCLVDLRTTRSAARALERNIFLCLLQSCCIGFCIISFVSVSVKAFLKMKTTVRCSKWLLLFLVTTDCNSLPKPQLDAKLCPVSKFASSNFLVFLPQLSYFALHSTSNQPSVCQRAIATVCQLSNLIYSPQWFDALKLRQKKSLSLWIAFIWLSICFFNNIKQSVQCLLFYFILEYLISSRSFLICCLDTLPLNVRHRNQ